jgi:hypothetical protein
MSITLDNNIEVNYNEDKSYIIETVKSDLYRKNENFNNIISSLQVAPVTPSLYIENGTNNVYAVESYTYSGAANTKDFTRVFPKNTTCDILIVGGGGAGGNSMGGGGGAGGVVYTVNQTLQAGTYNIFVAKGGIGIDLSIQDQGTAGVNQDGKDSYIQLNGTDVSLSLGGVSQSLRGKGGGGGGVYYDPAFVNGRNGGSGGGCSEFNPNFAVNTAGSATQGNTLWNGSSYVAGGKAGRQNTTTTNDYNAGGGGGAGNNGSVYKDGNAGVQINITGTSQFYAAGGGAGQYFIQNSLGEGIGGSGIGGSGRIRGSSSYLREATSGTNGTGSGGGGGSYTQDPDLPAGSGGSGIVIIRYLLGTIPANNLLTNANEPIITSPTFTESIRTFIHSGGTEAQTTHTITVARDTICDILIVGGGGGGDKEIGGGGGGGAVLYATNITIQAGTYQIKVGNGGAQNVNGSSSEAFGATCLGGGSTVYQAWSTGNSGTSGGSGSGGSANAPITAINNINGGGIGTSTKGTLLASGTLYNGNVGGNGSSSNSYHAGGGGGGAGTAGNNPNGNQITTRQSYINSGYPQKGGDGVPINITGTTYYWGAGGGGGTYDTHGGDGGLGGGGGGGASIKLAGLAGTGGINNGGNGVGERTGAAPYEVGGFGAPNTGSGGGGGGYFNLASGGAGGSGIVIIKFKSIVGAGIPEGNPITHKRLNFVYNNDNLVAWYKFNGDYLDSSGNGHNLTNVGTVIQSTHIIEGQAVEFDSTDYLEFPATINPYTIWNGKGITFSCWVRYTATLENWTSLINFQTDVSNNTGIGCWIRTTPVSPVVAIYLRINSTIFQYGDANTPLIANLNVWRHFVLCVGISGKIDVYIDNVRINGTETATIPNLTYNARYINRAASSHGTWDGQMDDFRIYDRALSSADVSLLYNKTYPVPSNTYALNFPVPTLADINNNSNIVLRGAYDIALSTSNALIIPKAGQYIPQPTTFTNYSIERMYPPVRNFTAATTTLSGQTYGNGTYVVSYSSTYGSSIDPWNCFNTANPGGAWPNNRYTAGTFNSTSFIVAGYLGDWLKIQLPVAIKLTRFEILMRTDSTQEGRERSPKDFRIYGSNDNITWVELVNKTDAVYNASYKYVQTTPEITNTYTYYGLVVNKLVGTSILLNFDEWYIYGQEVLTSSLSLRYNILNPILDPIGAQWTYSSSNTNVYHMGSVGIGTTNPSYTLDVRGSIFSSTGGFTQSGLTTWSIASDRRIKENIVKASYEKCLENVKNIELYNFNFKDNYVSTNDRHQLGFIAQEVQQVYPKAVEVGKMMKNMEEKIEGLLTLNTTQIDYTLYGAVKGLIQKLENIKIKIERIKSTSNITIQ